MIELLCMPANPGHFFACCGIFELASRAEPGCLSWFEAGRFKVECQADLGAVVAELRAAKAVCAAETDAGDDAEDEPGNASPLELGDDPPLRVDWWTQRGGKDLKVWAGSMDGPLIFRSMVKALPSPPDEAVLNYRTLVADIDKPKKKKEPFYFDARRGEHADARDVGFSPNDQDTRTLAAPAVEALTLVGLQRFRPAPVAKRPRVFTYRAWLDPLPALAATAVVAGPIGGVRTLSFQFESWFRTAQRKHKAFTMAIPIEENSR